MSKAKPINKTNAIESVSFGIMFDRQFNANECNNLLRLEKEFKKELPSFTQQKLMQIKMEQKKGEKPITTTEEMDKSVGVILQKFEKDGKPSWILQVVENSIRINCFEYTGWDKIWAKVNKYILSAAKALELDSCSIAAISLQYIDKFKESENANSYKPSAIFADNSKYLTNNIKDIGKLWHVHQGWFGQVTDGKKLLNVLNIGTTIQADDLVTRIEHTSHLQYEELNCSAEEVFKDKQYLDKIFSEMHENTKNVMRSLLNKEQILAIGM